MILSIVIAILIVLVLLAFNNSISWIPWYISLPAGIWVTMYFIGKGV